MGVTEVAYVNNDPAAGSVITIKCYEKLPMPVEIEVKEANGKMQRINLPAEIWQQGDTWKFMYNSTSRVQQVTLDPEMTLTDMDLSDNVWNAK